MGFGGSRQQAAVEKGREGKDAGVPSRNGSGWGQGKAWHGMAWHGVGAQVLLAQRFSMLRCTGVSVNLGEFL